MSESAFTAIQPVGRPSRGKKQRRFEEAERFISTGFKLFDEQQDPMALAAVTALLLGCRASEVVHCVAAGVPVVCPHSLRGLWATAGVRSGALSHTVAVALGHGSFKITAQHYMQPGTLDGARTERLVAMLPLKTPKLERDAASLHAEQIFSSLPAETLAKLTELPGQPRTAQEVEARLPGVRACRPASWGAGDCAAE